jgi:hypothetical protein
MKTQSTILAAVLALVSAAAAAQDKAAAAPAAASAQAAVAKRAQALTEEQINQSHDIEALTRLAELYNAQNDTQRFIWALRRVSELVPNSGDLKLQLAMAYAKADDKTRAYDTLMRMQGQGFGYDIGNDPRFESIHGTKVWDYIVKNLQVNAQPFGEGKVAYVLPKGDYLFDALAWDAKRGKLLAGSEREGKVYVVGEDGKLTDLVPASADHGLWGVTALGVDAARGKLYVASAATPRFQGFNAANAGKSAVFEFELASGKFLHEYAMPNEPGNHVLSALAVGPKGQVYVAEGARKRVFRLDGGSLKVIVQNQKLSGISAIAVTGDGRTLYLADYVQGIFGFDLGKAAAFELEYNPGQLVLGGTVGLNWYEGNLIVVTDGMVPKRVMRLKVSADGRKIEGAMPLDVAQPVFTALGQGTLAGDKLYFVANRQDALYDAHGVLTDAAALEATSVYRSNLRFAWGQAGVARAVNSIEPAKPGAPVSKKPGVPTQDPATH